MQLIKVIGLLSLILISVFGVYTHTKNAYFQRGVLEGELNTKLEVFMKLQSKIDECESRPIELADRLFQIKTSEILIKNDGSLCYIE